MQTHILDILNNVISTIRKTYAVQSITDNLDNTYTIVTSKDNQFALNEYVNFTNSSLIAEFYQIVSVISNNSFKISANSGIVIVLTGSVTSLRPYFSFEKWIPEANELTIKSVVNNYKLQKYPLIFCLLDIDEKRTQSKTFSSEINNLKIFLIDKTDPKKDAEWRLTNSFKSSLIPLYESFMTALIKSKQLIATDEIEHEYIERYYLGTSDKNQNKLNDFVDAIELTINNIKIKKTNNCNF